MRASLIIVAHDEGERLHKTVQSCLEATAELDCELIVADDASRDGSIEALGRRFPAVRVVRHARRRGVAPTRCAGARVARGSVMVFLDGHCKPEAGSLDRLVDDVERLDGRALVNPRVAELDAERWENRIVDGVGHGFHLDLETLSRRWTEPGRMRPMDGPDGRQLYESPGLMGCCLAIGRDLYEALGGFDAGMRMWGSEDLELGLRAWMRGYPVLHDPEPVVGHWFRPRDGADAVPQAAAVANELRLARRHFGEAVWLDWLGRCRARHAELPWRSIWHRFLRGRHELEQARDEQMARRRRDEFDYAARHELWWPRWLAGRSPVPGWGERLPKTPRGLLHKHLRHPRNRAVLSDADLVGVARDADGTALTIYLKLARACSGELLVEWATFLEDRPGLAAGAASWLTDRLQGEPLSRARALGPVHILRAFGVEEATAPADLLSACRLAGMAVRAALQRL